MKWLTLAVLLPLAALVIYASGSLPDRGDPDAPANVHLAPDLIEETHEEVHLPNVVSAVLADFRSWDTLGETVVIFTAGLGVLLVMLRGRSDDPTA